MHRVRWAMAVLILIGLALLVVSATWIAALRTLPPAYALAPTPTATATTLAAIGLFFVMTAFCNVMGEIFDNALWFLLAIPCTLLLMGEAANYWINSFGYILIAYDALRIGRYLWIAMSPGDNGRNS